MECPHDRFSNRVLRMSGVSALHARRSFCLLSTAWLVGTDTVAAPGPLDGSEGGEAAVGSDNAASWRARFNAEVDRRLDVPQADQERYFALMEQALVDAQVQGPPQAPLQAQAPALPTQAFLVVDRSAQVQAAMVIVRTAKGASHWLGATAVSTGKTGTYEHFLTPLGVFAHSLDNPDYRAEGTFNKNHIRGYGLRGRRVFDFGWQEAERGWGGGGISTMRLQMHATDPTVLEPRLGRVASEGCIRIPASLNVFLDLHGVLDADYEAAAATGKKLWVLNPKRQPVPWPGRYMVIVDSQAVDRPVWSPAPQA
jgi:hypothetical protein